MPFAFSDAFGCSRSLATFYDGILVPNFLAAFTTHIKTAIRSNRFHSFGCESGIHDFFLWHSFNVFEKCHRTKEDKKDSDLRIEPVCESRHPPHLIQYGSLAGSRLLVSEMNRLGSLYMPASQNSTAASPAPPFLVVFKFLPIGDVEYLRSFPSLVLARGSSFGQSDYPDRAHFLFSSCSFSCQNNSNNMKIIWLYKRITGAPSSDYPMEKRPAHS